MSTIVTHKSIELRFIGGGSYKTYIATVVSDLNNPQDVFSTECSYGKIGNVNSYATKAKNVSYTAATKAFDKVVAEKVGKGYKIISQSDGATQSISNLSASSAKVVVATHLPQLLNTVDEDDVPAMVQSGDWCLEEKMDGNRVQVGLFINISSGAHEVNGFNRKGQLIALPNTVRTAMKSFIFTTSNSDEGIVFLFDGELIGEHFHVFDCLIIGGKDISQKSYINRRQDLDLELEYFAGKDVFIHIVPLLECSRDTINLLRQQNAEGVVFKKKDSKYSAGRPNSGGPCLKLKFTESATCIVTKVNIQRSVQIGLLTEVYNWADEPAMIDVGNVTVPANKEIPKIGDLIEIRYLYMFPGGSLFQPVYLTKRDDIDESACTLGQVKRFKTSSLTNEDQE